MTQSKFWRFDINSQQNPTGQSSGTTGQTGQSNQAYLIIESNDQQSAVQQAKQMLGTQQSQSLGTPSPVDEKVAQQFSRSGSPQTA